MRVVFHRATQSEIDVESQRGRDERPGERGEQPRVAAITPEQGERPQHVELLFDRQRPGVVEVVVGGEGVAGPVKWAGRIGDRCASGCEDLPDSEVLSMCEPGTEVLPMDEQDHDGHCDDHQQRRPQPRGTSAVERRHIDRAVLELADQQRGDEIPRQTEEHRHPDEAVDQPPGHSVLAEDQKDGHTTQPIQARLVTTVPHDC
jgi:hypothetical protein